ncbi:MAG: hypothetical protein ACLFQB_10725 [Chitinispirillaceae bacterium]
MNKPFQILLLLLFLLGSGSNAKTRHSYSEHRARFSSAAKQTLSPSELENRFRPYLQQRTERIKGEARRRSRSRSFEIPRRTHYLALMKAWDKLSPEFKQLYKQATSIPSSFSSYLSPKGHFELFYTTTGRDSVDITDTVGFGAGGDWRQKEFSPNGIPDYIDEAAFALDSAWSMIVDRFGFSEPLASPGPDNSTDRYKVMFMRQANSSFYGITHLDGKQSDSDRGYLSHIEVNSNWSHPSWEPYGYDKEPYNALRVTCAHEFFHAVQYAMVWDVKFNILLDSYPLTWTEGSAVLMEELAFGYVNDYIQYANDYFLNPRITMLDENSNSGTEYINSILLKFIYEKVAPYDSIKLVKDIYTCNYEQKTPFYTNLEHQTEATGMLWVDILNGFHTESFFTGSRSRPGMFIADAELMDQWVLPLESPSTDTKSVKPYGMEVFSYKPHIEHTDTLKLIFDGDTEAEGQNRSWAAKVITRSNKDSVLNVNLDENGKGMLDIPGWKQKSKCVVVVTNGNHTQTRNMSIILESCPITMNPDETETLSVSSESSAADLSIKALQPLGCEASIDTASADSLLGTIADRTLHSASAFFDLHTPSTWFGSAQINLQISIPKEHFSTLPTTADSASIHRWNSNSATWEQINSTFAENNDSLLWSVEIEKSGLYAVLFRKNQPSASVLNIFPNVVNLSSGKPIRIEGATVYDVKIFSMDGTLVCRERNPDQFSTSIRRNSWGGVEWNLKNSRGKRIAPGMYLIAVSALDQSTMQKKTVKQKIMIVP